MDGLPAKGVLTGVEVVTEPLPLEVILDRVEDAPGSIAPPARRAPAAALETLAERISRDEVDDVAASLPEALGAALDARQGAQRGKASSASDHTYGRRAHDRAGLPPSRAG